MASPSLLGLPTELRIIILEHVMTNPSSYRKDTILDYARSLLSVDSTIRSETLEVLSTLETREVCRYPNEFGALSYYLRLMESACLLGSLGNIYLTLNDDVFSDHNNRGYKLDIKTAKNLLHLLKQWPNLHLHLYWQEAFDWIDNTLFGGDYNPADDDDVTVPREWEDFEAEREETRASDPKDCLSWSRGHQLKCWLNLNW